MTILLLVVFMLALSIYCLYQSAKLFFLPKYSHRKKILSYCGLALFILMIPNLLSFSDTRLLLVVSILSYVLALFLVTRLFYGEGRLLFWIGFSVITIVCCQLLNFSILAHFVPQFQNSTTFQILWMMVQALLPSLLQLLLSYFIVYVKKRQLRNTSVLFICGIALFTLYLLVESTYSLIFAPISLIAISGLILGGTLVFFTIRLLQQEKKIYQQSQQLLEKEGSLLKIQGNQDHYQEIRKLVHTFNQFALQLDKKIAANENQEARILLEDFLYQLNQNLASIHTNQSALDALLYYYLKQYPKISFNYQLRTLSTSNDSLEKDLLILMGKLLTLCVTSFQKNLDSTPEISLVLEEENQRLILEIRVTPCSHELRSSWQSAHLQETMAETLTQYAGDLHFQQIDNQGIISLLLFLKK